MIYIQFTPDGIRAEREPFDGGVAYGEVGEPVAWRYDCIKAVGDRKHLDPPFLASNRANMDPRYWTETPLYTGASANNELVDALSKGGFMMTETHNVGEHRGRKLVIGFQNPDDTDDAMQSDLAKPHIGEVLEGKDWWNCTIRFGKGDKARDAMRAFVDAYRTGKPIVVDEAQAALTAARAQVEGEIAELKDLALGAMYRAWSLGIPRDVSGAAYGLGEPGRAALSRSADPPTPERQQQRHGTIPTPNASPARNRASTHHAAPVHRVPAETAARVHLHMSADQQAV